MPYPTDVNPADVRLPLADLQVGIMARSKTADPRAVSAATGVPAELAGVFGPPVTTSVVPTGDGPPALIPELAALAPTQLVRGTADPFLHGPTRSAIEGHRRPVPVVAGASRSSPAR